MKNLLIIFAVLLATITHAQNNCFAGNQNQWTRGANANSGYYLGNRIYVADTATIENFHVTGMGSGDSIQVGIYNSGLPNQVGGIITVSEKVIITNGVLTLKPKVVHTLIPGNYFLYFRTDGLGPGTIIHDVGMDDTTNSYYFWSSGLPGTPWGPGNVPLDSICCGEFEIWMDLKCCPRLDTIQATACRSYTSPSGQHVYTESGWYTDTILPSTYLFCDTLVIIDLEIVPFDTALVQVDNFTLTSTDTGASFQWMDCDTDSLIAGATDSAYTDSTGGNFAVIIDKNGCIDTSGCYSISGISLSEFNQPELAVYPNPATGKVFIEGYESGEILDFQLKTIDGKDLNIRPIKSHEGSSYILPQPPGVYLLTITGDNRTEQHRVIWK